MSEYPGKPENARDPLRQIEDKLWNIRTPEGKSLAELLYFADSRGKFDPENMVFLAHILLNQDQTSQAIQERILKAIELEKSDKKEATILMEKLEQDIKAIKEQYPPEKYSF